MENQNFTKREIALKEGTKCLCIKDCYEEMGEEDEYPTHLYHKDTVYVCGHNGMLKDEDGFNRQWYEDVFTLSNYFHVYFKII